MKVTTLTSVYLHHNGMPKLKIFFASQTTFINIYKIKHIQGVPGGMDKTSGECSLC